MKQHGIPVRTLVGLRYLRVAARLGDRHPPYLTASPAGGGTRPEPVRHPRAEGTGLS